MSSANDSQYNCCLKVHFYKILFRKIGSRKRVELRNPEQLDFNQRTDYLGANLCSIVLSLFFLVNSSASIPNTLFILLTSKCLNLHSFPHQQQPHILTLNMSWKIVTSDTVWASPHEQRATLPHCPSWSPGLHISANHQLSPKEQFLFQLKSTGQLGSGNSIGSFTLSKYERELLWYRLGLLYCKCWKGNDLLKDEIGKNGKNLFWLFLGTFEAFPQRLLVSSITFQDLFVVPEKEMYLWLLFGVVFKSRLDFKLHWSTTFCIFEEENFAGKNAAFLIARSINMFWQLSKWLKSWLILPNVPNHIYSF